MTVATRYPAPHAYEVATPPAFTPIVRSMRDDELVWAIHSMGMAWKDSPGMRNRTHTEFKMIHWQTVRDALCRRDCTRVVVDGLEDRNFFHAPKNPGCRKNRDGESTFWQDIDTPCTCPPRAIGWMVMSRRPGYDAVHWVYVAKRYRRARSRGFAPFGAMTALLGHVVLQRSVVYTFEAACDSRLPRIPARAGERDSRPGRNDVWLAEYLRDRGHVVSHVPYAEWAK